MKATPSVLAGGLPSAGVRPPNVRAQPLSTSQRRTPSNVPTATVRPSGARATWAAAAGSGCSRITAPSASEKSRTIIGVAFGSGLAVALVRFGSKSTATARRPSGSGSTS